MEESDEFFHDLEFSSGIFSQSDIIPMDKHSCFVRSDGFIVDKTFSSISRFEHIIHSLPLLAYHNSYFQYFRAIQEWKYHTLDITKNLLLSQNSSGFFRRVDYINPMKNSLGPSISKLMTEKNLVFLQDFALTNSSIKSSVLLPEIPRMSISSKVATFFYEKERWSTHSFPYTPDPLMFDSYKNFLESSYKWAINTSNMKQFPSHPEYFKNDIQMNQIVMLKHKPKLMPPASFTNDELDFYIRIQALHPPSNPYYPSKQSSISINRLSLLKVRNKPSAIVFDEPCLKNVLINNMSIREQYLEIQIMPKDIIVSLNETGSIISNRIPNNIQWVTPVLFYGKASRSLFCMSNMCFHLLQVTKSHSPMFHYEAFMAIQSLVVSDFYAFQSLLRRGLEMVYCIALVIAEFTANTIELLDPHIEELDLLSSNRQFEGLLIHAHKITCEFMFHRIISSHFREEIFGEAGKQCEELFENAHSQVSALLLSNSNNILTMIIKLINAESIPFFCSLISLILESRVPEVDLFLRSFGSDFFVVLNLISTQCPKQFIREIARFAVDQRYSFLLFEIFITESSQHSLTSLFSDQYSNFLRALLSHKTNVNRVDNFEFAFSMVSRLVQVENDINQMRLLKYLCMFLRRCSSASKGNPSDYITLSISLVFTKLILEKEKNSFCLESFQILLKDPVSLSFLKQNTQKMMVISFFIHSNIESVSASAWKVLRTYVIRYPSLFKQSLNNPEFGKKFSSAIEILTPKSAIQFFKMVSQLINNANILGQKKAREQTSIEEVSSIILSSSIDMKKKVQWAEDYLKVEDLSINRQMYEKLRNQIKSGGLFVKMLFGK